jgi:hypothetical protein
VFTAYLLLDDVLDRSNDCAVRLIPIARIAAAASAAVEDESV